MTRRPGDYLLDLYLPDASEEARELARVRFQEFARWLIRVAREQAKTAAQSDDSQEHSPGDTMESTAPPSP